LTLIGDIHGAYSERSKTASTEQLIQKGVAYLETLARESEGDVLLRRDLARAYGLLGRVQGYPIWAHSGNEAKARDNYVKAISIRESLLAADPHDRELRVELSGDYVAYALSLLPSSAARSLQMQRRSLALIEEVAKEDPDRRMLHVHFFLASGVELVGETYGHPYYANVGDTARALAYCQRAFEMRRALDATAARNGYHGLGDALRYDFGDSYNLMAGVLWAIGKLDLALQYQE